MITEWFTKNELIDLQSKLDYELQSVSVSQREKIAICCNVLIDFLEFSPFDKSEADYQGIIFLTLFIGHCETQKRFLKEYKELRKMGKPYD